MRSTTLGNDYQFLTSNDAEFKTLKKKVDDLEANFRRDQRDFEQTKINLKKWEERHDSAIKAREVIQRAALKTQEHLEYHISNLVTLAQEAVFGSNAYEFGIKFVKRRNKTECDLFLIKKGEVINDPIRSVGGGPCDVASFALRCAFWSLKRTRPVMIFDEPFRFVNDDPDGSRELQEKCALMTREIVDRLKLQAIIVTTLPEFLAIADRIIKVRQEGNISNTTED